MDLPPSVRPYTRKIWAKKVTTKTLGGITATSWLDTPRYGSALNVTNGVKDECQISSSRSGMLASSRFGYWSSWLHTGSSGSGSSA